ncbi:MAG: MerR family transcriptional regulator [Desulfococcaceae bacterium]|jgi:DNA-binding transcriptional MerR regulator|nr:MerR family transcriptional regulator [Desulfococcaceae bacterium]
MGTKRMSIPQMARELKAVEQTIRRYTERFPEFFSPESEGGVKYYGPEALTVLGRIAGLYGEGKKKEEIREILNRETPDMKSGILAEKEAQPSGLHEEVKGIRKALESIDGRLKELTEVLKAQK